jgi:hypothetical protein
VLILVALGAGGHGVDVLPGAEHLLGSRAPGGDAAAHPAKQKRFQEA